MNNDREINDYQLEIGSIGVSAKLAWRMQGISHVRTTFQRNFETNATNAQQCMLMVTVT
jgi:hypothetical protein